MVFLFLLLLLNEILEEGSGRLDKGFDLVVQLHVLVVLVKLGAQLLHGRKEVIDVNAGDAVMLFD